MHPYLFHTGHFYLPTFGVLAAVGLMAALALSEYTARLVQIDSQRLWDAGIFLIVAAFVLSRALLVATNWHTFSAFPILLLAVSSLTPPGMLLAALASLLYLRWRQVAILPALDAWAPAGTLVWAALALGHFFEGSDPGLPTAKLSSVVTPESVFAAHQPVALYAALAALCFSATLVYRLRRNPAPGHTAGLGLLLCGLAQYLLSFLREPGISALGGLDQLQWVALGMLAAGALLLSIRFNMPLRPSATVPASE